MALPHSRAEFKAWCLRSLGDGVVQINVTDNQIEDRIDEAVEYFQLNHFNGVTDMYIPKRLTATDITNKYITLSDNILGVSRIFKVTPSVSGIGSLLTAEFAVKSDAMYSMILGGGSGLANYSMTMDNISLMNELFNNEKPIHFNRLSHNLYIDMDWSGVVPDVSYIMIDATTALDPTTYNTIWSDPWLIKYAVQLIKHNWGSNAKKYQGVTMPGGLFLDGQTLYNEAAEEIAKLEEEMADKWQLPPMPQIG